MQCSQDVDCSDLAPAIRSLRPKRTSAVPFSNQKSTGEWALKRDLHLRVEQRVPHTYCTGTVLFLYSALLYCTVLYMKLSILIVLLLSIFIVRKFE